MVVGCGLFKAPNMAAQARDADDSDREKNPWVGRIDANLTPVAGREESRSSRADDNISYIGIEDGKICFSAHYWSQYFSSHATLAEFVERRRTSYENTKLVFATYDSLAPLTDQTPWPATSLNHVTEISLISKKIEKHQGSRDSNKGRYN